MDFNQAVRNVVVGGKTAGGLERAAQHIQFPKTDAQALNALARACETLSNDIGTSMEHDGPMTALIIKLANYLGKRGSEMTKAFDDVRYTLRDAILEDPTVLESKKPVDKIIEAHSQRSAQKAAALREEMIKNPPPTPRVILTIGKYTLHELISPAHLKQESAYLKHCVGTSHNAELLAERGLEEGDPGAEDCLVYAVKIRSGEIRVFSLRNKGDKFLRDEGGTPVATIDYDTRKKRITQIEGNPRKISGKEGFFPDLCEALYQLGQKIDLSGGIAGLPETKKGEVLTREGKIEFYCAGYDLSKILSGTIMVDEQMGKEELHALCACPYLMLDIAKCSNEWLNGNLLPEIRANLRSTSTRPLILSHIKEAVDIDVKRAKTFDAPALQHAGNIFASGAETFSAPALQRAGHIDAWNAKTFSAHALLDAGKIIAQSAKTFDAPALQRAGDINAWNAQTFDAPALQSAGYIDARKAETFHAPALQRAGDIFAQSAEIVDLRSLAELKELQLGENLRQITLHPDADTSKITGIDRNQFAKTTNTDGTIILSAPAPEPRFAAGAQPS